MSELFIAIAISATYENGGFAPGSVEDGDVDGVGVEDILLTEGEIVDTAGGVRETLFFGLLDVGILLGHLKQNNTSTFSQKNTLPQCEGCKD